MESWKPSVGDGDGSSGMAQSGASGCHPKLRAGEWGFIMRVSQDSELEQQSRRDSESDRLTERCGVVSTTRATNASETGPVLFSAFLELASIFFSTKG